MNVASEQPDEGATLAGANPTPGTTVRDTRERAGVSVEDLAAQLKLSRATLEALERDDYETLNEAVYVRGYFRKIAKVLPVDADALVAEYDTRAGHPTIATPHRVPLAGGVAAGATHPGSGQGIGLVALAIVAIGALYLFTKAAPEPLAVDRGADRRPEKLAPEPNATRPADENAADALPEGSDTAESVQASEPSTEIATDPEPGSVAAPTAAPAPAPTATASTGALVLEFRDSTFVRVEDARNRTLLIGLVRGGQRESLSGEPPYTVFIGNVRNVTVQYAGQAIDLAPHVTPDGDTARLTIP